MKNGFFPKIPKRKSCDTSQKFPRGHTEYLAWSECLWQKSNPTSAWGPVWTIEFCLNRWPQTVSQEIFHYRTSGCGSLSGVRGVLCMSSCCWIPGRIYPGTGWPQMKGSLRHPMCTRETHTSSAGQNILSRDQSFSHYSNECRAHQPTIRGVGTRPSHLSRCSLTRRG